MRVLYLANSAEIGGGNKSLETLWRCIQGAGVWPMAIYPSEGPMVELCRGMGVAASVVAYRQPSWRRPGGSLLGVRGWWQLLRQAKPDVIHANDLMTARSVSATAKVLGLPLVCHIRFHAEPEFLRWVFRGLPKPEAFIFNSRAMRDLHGPLLSQVCPEAEQFVVYNGVSTELFSPGDEECQRGRAPRVGIIANLVPVKGHMDFLEMARLLEDQDMGAEYWIVGGDVHRLGLQRQLEQRAQELGLRERVRFLGHRPDVPEVLRSMDVVVSAAEREAFGRCLIEAMACQIPVVGTRVDGVPEVIDDGITGFLAEPNNPADLAGKVRVLLLDSRLRAKMGKAGRRRVEMSFSDAQHARRIVEIYDRLR